MTEPTTEARTERFVRRALSRVPIGAHDGWNRYDTDDEHVLSLWANGQTWDIRVARMDWDDGPTFIGSAEARATAIPEPTWCRRHHGVYDHCEDAMLARLEREAEARATVPAGLDVLRLARLIVSYADLTHETVVKGGDWRDIAAEWSKVVDAARAALAADSEPER